MDKFLIGTKFYRVGDSGIPEIIRLKKQIDNVVFFNTGGFNTYLTQDEIENMISAGEFKIKSDNKFIRIIKYFNNTINQVWEVISDSKEDMYVKFKVENIGVSMTLKELKENYIRLVPDGFMAISNIKYPIDNGEDEGFDVLVTLNKFGNDIPEIICRQDCIDVFKYSNSSMQIPIGISIPKIACPSNMNYLDFLYSRDCINFKSTAVYLDDSLNTVLKYIGSLNKYNGTMKRLKEKYSKTQMVGCNDNIYDLLINTGFYADYQSVFGVFTFPFGIDTNRSEFNNGELRLLNSVVNNSTNKIITQASYCPYDKCIDMKDIDSKHLLINTGNVKESDIFIIAYEEEIVG